MGRAIPAAILARASVPRVDVYFLGETRGASIVAQTELAVERYQVTLLQGARRLPRMLYHDLGRPCPGCVGRTHTGASSLTTLAAQRR